MINVDKKTFVKMLNEKRFCEYGINLSYLGNILFDIENGHIPFYKDILTFNESLTMKDSLFITKNYLKMLEFGFNSVYTLKLYFGVQNIIKEHKKRNKRRINPKYKY